MRDKSPDQNSDRLQALIATNLRLFRAQRGMTRKQLAEQSGVSVPHLARLEGGQGNVSLGVLAKLATAVNQPLAKMIAEHPEQQGDLELIVEFLKQQPTSVLAGIRRQLIEQYGSSSGDRCERIALIGLRGAGKSSVGKHLAKRLDLPFIELDREIEQEVGTSLQEVITLYGQSGYRNLELRCLERIIAIHSCVVLATGGGIVTEPTTYELLLRAFRTVWLQAEPELHFTRVMEQHDARIATPSMHKEAMDNIHRSLEARQTLYEMADVAIDTSRSSVNEVVEQIITLREKSGGREVKGGDEKNIINDILHF
jgi:XRE family aerobic/anaerobic benzoate catabolism transcriptional regulator